MFESVTVIGANGRSGSAVGGRLRQRGVPLLEHDGELIVLCVPDRAIGEVAARIEPGHWICHVSGATSLGALDPHELRFSVHPLQTLVKWRGPEQLDGAFGAVTAETDDARERGWWLAHTLGLQPSTWRTRGACSTTRARCSRAATSSGCTAPPSRYSSSPGRRRTACCR